MLDIDEIIDDKFPSFKHSRTYGMFGKLLKSVLHQDEINSFLEQHQHLRGLDFIDKALEHLDFTYNISARSLDNIPAEGRLIIIANHPIGSLDGLALLKMIGSVRSDVRIVVNDVLEHIDPLKPFFLPVDNMSTRASHKDRLRSMLSCLENEEAIIIFPAGEVSRIRPNGVRDGKWKAGFISLAEKSQAPILPIYINGKNSSLFYSMSALYKPLGTALLAHEMFNKANKYITFHVGNPIPWRAIRETGLNKKQMAKRFRKHLYRINNPHKKPLFPTIRNIVHPVKRRELKRSLYTAERLGTTPDGKIIFLYDYCDDSPVMREIGRLREKTFRSVEEGTGESIDLDIYDTYYRHLILWDEEQLEIVGAYRIGESSSIIKKHGLEGLYTHSLFDLQNDFHQFAENSIELGRSFVQPKYWGSRSLEYLWCGIGAYHRRHPHIKYLFGGVSLSNAYPHAAKEIIISFYDQQFGDCKSIAKARQPFVLSASAQQRAAEEFSGAYRPAYQKLRERLAEHDCSVPTLYKQYAELCEGRGCAFVSFNVDPLFNNCVDSLIMVRIEQMKAQKFKRYFTDRQ